MKKTVVENYEKTLALSMRVGICFATRAATCNKTIKKRIENYEKTLGCKEGPSGAARRSSRSPWCHLPTKEQNYKKRFDQNETTTVTKTIKKRCQHEEKQNDKKRSGRFCSPARRGGGQNSILHMRGNLSSSCHGIRPKRC